LVRLAQGAAVRRDGTLRAGLLAGALFAAEFTCIYLGLRDTTASRLTVFLYTSPFVVALLLPRWCRPKSCGRCNGSGW
jgi:drug/metabolite transporter (DMT)-like permease